MEGKNIIIEYRFAEGNRDRLRQLTAEIVRLEVDIIVSGGPTVTRPVKEATATIPIVMGLMMTLLARGLSPALRDRAGTLLDCRPLPRK